MGLIRTFFERCVFGFVCSGILFLAPVSRAANEARFEITYPSKAYSKLDTFEALNLEDSDKLFNQKDYKGAFAAYKAYSFEFSKSPSLPYVLLRMGRCLHLLGKRHAAVKAYQDVVDYFPDDVAYAAGALYHAGEAHGQNGDISKQTAIWAKMVKDDDYVLQPKSGTALVHLAGAMDKLKKYEEATEYRWRTAVAFAKSNETAARDARYAVIKYYTSSRPNHDKLKEFFVDSNAFADRAGKGDNPQEDVRYWRTVLATAPGSGENKEDVARYWVGKIGSLFKENDELRIKAINLQLVYEKDKVAWGARLSKQFSQKPGTIARVVYWIPQINDVEQQLAFAMKYGGPLVAGAKPSERTRIMEQMRWNRDKFYAKWVLSTVKGLKTEEKVWLMNRLRHPCGLHEEAQSVLRQVNLSGMADKDIVAVGNFAGSYLKEEDVLRYYAKVQDKQLATKARFDYYMSKSHRNNPFKEKALAEMPALKKIPKYAGQALAWTEATLLRDLGRHDEAIKAFRTANKQPDSTWAVTDCMVAMKQYGAAIKNVQGLESVKATASAACLKIADIYKAAGDKGKEVEQLRLVLVRYKKSGQSSSAHQRLESYGVSLSGGESVAEE